MQGLIIVDRHVVQAMKLLVPPSWSGPALRVRAAPGTDSGLSQAQAEPGPGTQAGVTVTAAARAGAALASDSGRHGRGKPTSHAHCPTQSRGHP